MVAIDAALCDSWCGSAPALSSTIVIACMAAGPSKVLKKSPRGDAIVVVSLVWYYTNFVRVSL